MVSRQYPVNKSHFVLRSLLALLLVGLLSGSGVVAAHPADMYLQTYTIEVTAEQIAVDWAITPGTLLAFLTWDQADINDDAFVDEQEAIDWIAPYLSEVTVAVDETLALQWIVDAVIWPESLAEFEMGNSAITVQMHAFWPSDFEGQHQIILYNRFEEAISVNWFYLQAAGGMEFSRPQQTNGLLRFDLLVDADSVAEADGVWFDTWDSGTPSLDAATGEVVPVSSSSLDELQSGSASAILTGLVSAEELSPLFYLLALGIALVLGAIHALTPGHGKTLVAAYLVGTRGTTRHAAALGLIVTLTHTGSVLAIGVITLFASRFILPTTLFPLLEIASGLLILGMGVGLLLRRWQGFQAVRRKRQQEAQADTAPVADAPPVQAADTSKRVIAINEAIPVRDYDDVLPQGDISLATVNWRQLLALGISGGIVPCPDAIAILLVAIAINRLVLGLSLVVAFSFGLAAILIAIGIAMVRSRSLFARMDAFNRLAPALPVASAVIVLLLGAVLTYNAVGTALATSPGSTDALAALRSDDAETGFVLSRASVVYMASVESGIAQLFVAPVNGGAPQALTDEPGGIWDYALAPDNQLIAYTAPRSDGGSTLWGVQPDGSNRQTLLDCPEASCRNVLWAPDGKRLLYERIDFYPTSGILNGTPSLWWLAPASGETGPVFQDSQLPGYSAGWSPDGQWISYISAGTSGLQLYNLSDGSHRVISTQTGAAAIWQPGGDTFLMTDIEPVGTRYLTHLLRYTMETEDMLDLTAAWEGELTAEDSNAAWSPDGTQIATVRRVSELDALAPHNQIWLMQPDGSAAYALTDQQGILHLTPVWAPDGSALVFTQYRMADSYPQPEIWMIETESGALQQITALGEQPVFLP